MAESTIKEIEQKSTETTENDQDFTEDVSMEYQNEDSKSSDVKSGETGKVKYTEAERLKRKEYFKQLREKRRQKYFKYKIKRLSDQNVKNLEESDGESNNDIQISFNMTEEDVKCLEFYKIRLTTLQDENELLHKRLAYLVKENMRLLQKGPPLL